MSDKDVIAALQGQNEQLTEMVLSLTDSNEQLKSENKKLRREIARLKKDSSNSSKPPSSDFITKPKNQPATGKGKGKRKRGGQKGHKKHDRKLFSSEEVDVFKECVLPQEQVKQRDLTPLDEWAVYQQVELKDKPFIVTQYDRRVYLDDKGKRVIAPLPEDVDSTGYFGINLQAFVGYMKGSMSASYSQIEELCKNLGIHVSRGYLTKICTGNISDALEVPYQEALEAIRNEKIVGSDETGLKNNGKLNWAWCLAAAEFTVFHIDESRGSKVLFDILGEDYAGVLLADYYNANKCYLRYSLALGQYCWAHLIRDIKYISDTYIGKVKRWADTLLDITRRIFSIFHRRHGMTERGYLREINRHRKAFLRKVSRPPDIKEARNISTRFEGSGAEDYFRFIDIPGLEPTNNRTEQKIRLPAIQRRITQGTRSIKGMRWCEKIWSVVTSCKQQGYSAYVFLKEALSAHL